MELLEYFIGIFVGLMGALIPGLHTNTLISIFSGIYKEKEALAYFIIGLFPAQIVASLIPSIFFGIPNKDNVLLLLSGHKLVLEGRGLSALKSGIFSILLSSLIAVGVFLISKEAYSLIYSLMKGNILIILLIFCLISILKTKKPPLSLLIFLACGVLGQLTFGLKLNDPFLPLFSGLFAVAAIIEQKNTPIPDQKEETIDFDFKKPILIGVVLGFLSNLLPAVGSSGQMASFGTLFVSLNSLEYVALTSSITASQAVFSFSSAISIDKTRIGATANLDKSIELEDNIFLILSLFLISIAVCAVIIFKLRKNIVEITKIDFETLGKIVLVYLFVITFILDGLLGIIVLGVAGLLGWLCIKLGVERTNLMGSIILPTILLLLK